MRVEGGTSNIINGVSRQPSEIRLTSQLEESVNQFPTLTRGLVPRNPTRRVGDIQGSPPQNSITHLIDRDETEQYIVTISPSGVTVHDLNGAQKIVNAPHGYSYLSGGTPQTLEALTVADHTFILNKNVTVQPSYGLSPAYLGGGLIHVVQSDYGENYQIFIDGTLKAQQFIHGPHGDSTDHARQLQAYARTSNIARGLYDGQTVVWPHPFTDNLTVALPANAWELALYTDVIHVRRKNQGAFSLSVKPTYALIRAHKDTVPHLADLPRRAPHGFGIKITGSQESNYDDYYVKFHHPTGIGEGAWKETVAERIPYQINPATMPHILVRNSNGTFTFKQATWAGREVGDLETNPWPSFVGNKIKGMIFHKNRMGFHSGESISLSRNGEFFNFFIESVLTPLDTDPVDISIAYPDVSDIYHSVSHGGELLLFTSSVPFHLTTGGELFTPKSVSIEPLLDVEASPKVKPVTGGNNCYFVNDKPSGSFVHELTIDPASGSANAHNLTDHVQGYVPKDIHLMAVDADLKILILASKSEPETLYIYKWLWVGQDKVQAAWQKWQFEHPIITMKFFGEDLILITQLSNMREILRLNCHEAAQSPWPFMPLLDRQVAVSGGNYDPITKSTTLLLPYASTQLKLLSTKQKDFGVEYTILDETPSQVTVKGDVRGGTLIGVPFESYCILPKLHYRTTDNQGNYGNAKAGTRLTVANLTLQTGVSAYLDVTLERDYRQPYIYHLSAAKQGTKTGKVGEVVMGTIIKPLSIMANQDDFKIKIGNSTPYPYSLLSYQWTGRLSYAGY